MKLIKVHRLLVRYLPEENMQLIFYMWDTYLGIYIYIHIYIYIFKYFTCGIIFKYFTCGIFRHVFFTCDIFTCAMDTLHE